MRSAFTYAGLFAILYIYFKGIDTEKEFITVISYFISGVFTLTAILLVQYDPTLYVFDPGSQSYEISVLGGGEVSHYEVAHYSLSAFLGCLTLYNYSNFNRKYLLSFLTLYFVICIILSLSRAYISALLACSIIWLIFQRGFINKVKRFFNIFFAMVVVAFLIIKFNPEVIQFRFLDTFTAVNEVNMDTMSSGRLNIWRHALELYKLNPLFGAGLSSFGFLHGYEFGIDKGAHNSFMQYLVELGIFGLILFILTIVFCILKFSTFTKYKGIAYAIIVFFLFQATF